MIKVSRLPFRAAAGILASSVLVLLVLGIGTSVAGWFVVAASAATGVAAFVIVRFLLEAKLRQLERILLALESRSFEAVSSEALDGNDELSELARLAVRSGMSLRTELERLRKIENYRRDFIGNVSHELKTPIFAIKGFSETLLGGAVEDDQVNRSFVRKILRNADRLDNLARDLSEISAMETGQLQMERAPFSIPGIVKDVVESLEPPASEKGIVVRAVLPDSLPEALGDADRIRQVLTNLVDNAVKYTNQGGNVEVVARFVEPGKIKISVVDNGIGVAREHLPRLTERFYRVDKSRSRSQGGTGLGLSIVKHILAAHGQKLQVSSSEERGSTFGFSLETVSPVEYDPDQIATAITS